MSFHSIQLLTIFEWTRLIKSFNISRSIIYGALALNSEYIINKPSIWTLLIGSVAPDTELAGYSAEYLIEILLIFIFYSLHKMGPDFLDRQSLWYMFCCNFINLIFCFQSKTVFSGRISGQIPDIKKAEYPVQP